MPPDIGAAPQCTATGYRDVTDRVSAIVLERPVTTSWLAAIGVCLALVALFVAALAYLFLEGVGIWGINIPVAWGFAITNYVWWIGIAMAGTFISAALMLLRQRWRASINRFAESITVFALAIAGLFPIMHLGRPWFFYWLFPYPDAMGVWPQWRSALVWDFVAIVSYVLISVTFWYVGMIPDLATLRDRAHARAAQVFYGLLALGWRGEARHWARHRSASVILAGIAVPLVFSVHSMVALDFSEGATPGWHTTLFPPFFVAGALYSGFAVVLAVAVPLRAVYGLQRFIPDGHLESLAKALLAAGLVVTYGYAMEIFGAWYSGDPYEMAMISHRMTGLYAPAYWATITFNSVIPQLLWLRSVRARPMLLALISAGIILGMWLERFVLVVTSLYRSYIPSEWQPFFPTVWDWAHLVGSLGIFGLLFLLFVRLLPLLSMFETRRLMHERSVE